MLQRIKLQTPDGIREYVLVPGSDAYDAARGAGEIHIGDEIVYRNYLVAIMDDFEMLVLERIQMGDPVFGGGMGPQFAPPPGGFATGSFGDRAGWNTDGANWSFTINGVPLTPEQMEQFAGGGFARN